MDHQHSAKSILKGLGAAFIIGAIVVLTIIWPAEYGKDPTGVGALLGLTIMSAEELAVAESTPPTQSTALSSAFADVVESASAVATSEKVIPITVWPLDDMESAPLENIQSRPAAFRSDSAEVTLQSGQAMEYKVELLEGEPLMYSWTTMGGEIYTDLHAEPTVNRDSYPEHYFYRYEELEDTDGHGRFTAPFTGNHGWYLLNRNASPVTFRLEVSGFHSDFKTIEKETQLPAN